MSSPPSHEPNTEWHTPQKARIKALRDDAHWTFRQIIKQTGIPKSLVAKLYHNMGRRSDSGPHKDTQRGRPLTVSPKDIRNMEQILESHEFESKALTWEQLGYEAGLDLSGRTIHRVMGTMDYH